MASSFHPDLAHNQRAELVKDRMVRRDPKLKSLFPCATPQCRAIQRGSDTFKVQPEGLEINPFEGAPLLTPEQVKAADETIERTMADECPSVEDTTEPAFELQWRVSSNEFVAVPRMLRAAKAKDLLANGLEHSKDWLGRDYRIMRVGGSRAVHAWYRNQKGEIKKR